MSYQDIVPYTSVFIGNVIISAIFSINICIRIFVLWFVLCLF